MGDIVEFGSLEICLEGQLVVILQLHGCIGVEALP